MNIFLKRNKIHTVFVDWFGVLSVNFYWCEQSKLNTDLKKWSDSVFKNSERLNNWMRGKHTLSDLVSSSDEMELIMSSFEKDKAYYEPDWDFLNALELLFPNSRKILISDNIPLFTEKVLLWYPELRKRFNSIYVSADSGVLKKDRPVSLFNLALKEMPENSFAGCVLVDDDWENCEYFKSLGGRVILIN